MLFLFALLQCIGRVKAAANFTWIYPPNEQDDSHPNAPSRTTWLVGSKVNISWMFTGDGGPDPTYSIFLLSQPNCGGNVASGSGPAIYHKENGSAEVGYFEWTVDSQGEDVTKRPCFLLDYDSDAAGFEQSGVLNFTTDAAVAASASSTAAAASSKSTAPSRTGSTATASLTQSASPAASAVGFPATANSTSATSQQAGAKGLSGGAIAGIVIGAVAGLLILLVCLWLCSRRFALVRRKAPADDPAAAYDMKEGYDGKTNPGQVTSFEIVGSARYEAPDSQIRHEMEGDASAHVRELPASAVDRR